MGWYLGVLTVIIVLLMVLGSPGGWEDSARKYLKLILILGLLLLLRFVVRSFLGFYFFFESSLLPIYLMIIGWGYQPERLYAGIRLILYTVVASMPLFLVLVYWHTSLMASRFYLVLIFKRSQVGGYLGVLFIIRCLGFLVKFPIYFFHLWLPKAHVEAPVGGSMILAGVLLKLGGFGLWRVSFLFGRLGVVRVVQLFSVGGGALVRFLCLRQRDMKLLIAYSSVAHMRIVISVFLRNRRIGIYGGLLIMLSHGITSSGLFLGANMVYSQCNSRRILISKRVFQTRGIFTLG